eukprot:CAMPEP_0185749406 /NCGR_PEP_ID=MMETSP1174-20130828/8102_1 /TAXON_ID=35687 /ORGANISM="Dictyocha speculum, Strain CCMP1381" /LENGTH=185 /DNA_ID=CAMNT_0028425495 /DNA_START=89 /DNA_END=643 /DNA_ORIENTATION=-
MTPEAIYDPNNHPVPNGLARNLFQAIKTAGQNPLVRKLSLPFTLIVTMMTATQKFPFMYFFVSPNSGKIHSDASHPVSFSKSLKMLWMLKHIWPTKVGQTELPYKKFPFLSENAWVMAHGQCQNSVNGNWRKLKRFADAGVFYPVELVFRVKNLSHDEAIEILNAVTTPAVQGETAVTLKTEIAW